MLTTEDLARGLEVAARALTTVLDAAFVSPDAVSNGAAADVAFDRPSINAAALHAYFDALREAREHRGARPGSEASSVAEASEAAYAVRAVERAVLEAVREAVTRPRIEAYASTRGVAVTAPTPTTTAAAAPPGNAAGVAA